MREGMCGKGCDEICKGRMKEIHKEGNWKVCKGEMGEGCEKVFL